jgi:putative ABC transport system permease protein
LKIVVKAFLRYLLRRRSLSILQLLGIACGVAAVIGMGLSARSALSSFNKAIEFLRGSSTHLIERPAGPIDERVLVRLMRDPSVDFLAPVIDRRLRLADGEAIRVLGIDPFLDRAVRPEISRAYFAEMGRSKREDHFSFFTGERSVLIDSNLAAQLKLVPGSRFETSQGVFTVISTFKNPSGEPLILMDILNAQKMFDLKGSIDRVDLIVNDEAAFRSRWEKGFRIESKRQRQDTLTALLYSFKLNLQALSLLALFVGTFLIYNTAMFVVVSRRRDAGVLRSLGARRIEIVAAFMTEIFFFGILGGALGAVFGYILSRFLTEIVGSTISTLYFFLKPSPQPWSLLTLAAGIAFGCIASLLGSVAPLIELILTEPVKAIRGRIAYKGGRRKAGKIALTGLGILCAAAIFLLFSFYHVYVGYAGTFVFLLGVSLFTGFTIMFVAPPLKWLFSRIGGIQGKLAVANIRKNMGRTAVAIAAFMVALSMSIGLGSMIESFRYSLIWWMNSQLKGELYVSTKGDADVPEDFYEEVKQVPGIGGVDTYRNVQVTFRGTPVYITAINASILQRFTRFGWVSGGNENWEPVKQGSVIISESFSRRFNVKKGDTVTVEGIEGAVQFPVTAIFYDYTTEHGLIMMDRSTYIRHFKDRTINSLGIFVDPQYPEPAKVIAEVKRRAQSRNLPIATRSELHNTILSVFDNTFAVTRSMRVLAIIVAFFGIAGALMTLFVERRREFGIYRALGFSVRQIAGMTLFEGIGMGIVSFLMSIGVGTALALILIKVINLRSFNWTIFYHFTFDPYLLAGITAIAASIGASLYPIWKVYRTYPQIQIREE